MSLLLFYELSFLCLYKRHVHDRLHLLAKFLCVVKPVKKSFSLSSCLHLWRVKLKVFIVFASRPIACEMGVLKVFIVRILFAGRPIACEMGVLQVFIVMILFEFDELLVLKFQFPLACQPYRLDKSILKNFIPVFCTWNWNNHHLLHLWKVSLFLCLSKVTAACYVLLFLQLYSSRAF